MTPEDMAATAAASVKEYIAARCRALEETFTALVKDTQADLDARIAAIPAGRDGRDVTPQDVQPMIDDAVARAVSALPAPRDGRDVTPQDVQPMIDDAVARAISALPAPVPGQAGRDGADGRDALALEIMPSIDFEKSYPRGTYALHRGGLWRSFQKTDAAHGWECVVNGIAEMNVGIEEDRTLVVRTVLADGVENIHKTILPVVIDRGVWRDGTYMPGDGVTCGGNYFIAQKQTDQRPGGNEDWRLAVRKGRDLSKPVPVKLAQGEA